MKKILYSILLLFVLCLFSACGGISFGSVYPNGDSYTVGNAEFSAEVDTLYIDWSAYSVSLVPADTETISISEKANRTLSDEEAVHWLLDGKTLRVEYCASGAVLPSDTKKELTVTYPASVRWKTLEIGTASADIVTGDLSAETVSLSTASGSIRVPLLAADTAEFSTASGNITAALDGVSVCRADSASGDITLTGSADKIDASAASGSCSFSAEIHDPLECSTASGDVSLSAAVLPRSTTVSTASGSVSLYFPENAGFTLSYSTASGDFSTELPAVLKEDVCVCGDGAAKIDISTSSGDISVSKLP